MNSTLFNIETLNCNVEKEIAVMSICVSVITADYVSFVNCTSMHCSVLLMTSSNFFASNMTFNDNKALSQKTSQLIFSINSIFEFEDSNITNNYSPDSNVLKCDYFSYTGLWHLNFSNNTAFSIISADTAFTLLNISNTSFIGNRGMLIDSSSLSNITIDNTTFVGNNGMEMPLLSVKNTDFNLNNISFVSNRALNLVNIQNSVKNCTISNSSSINDIADGSLIYSNNLANISFNSLKFDNSSAKEAIITTDSTNITINELNISSAKCRSLSLINNSKIKVSESSFIKPHFQNSTVWIDNSNIIIQNSRFVDWMSIRGNSSKVLIINVNFTASKIMAHDDWMITVKCNYGKDYSIVFLLLIVAMFVSGVGWFAWFVKKQFQKKEKKSSSEGSFDETQPLITSVSHRVGNNLV